MHQKYDVKQVIREYRSQCGIKLVPEAKLMEPIITRMETRGTIDLEENRVKKMFRHLWQHIIYRLATGVKLICSDYLKK